MLSVSKETMSRWNGGGIEVGERMGTVLFCLKLFFSVFEGIIFQDSEC